MMPARAEGERKALLLTLDPQQDFMTEIVAGLQGCITGEASRFRCAGPLAEHLMTP
jgi:hypothetical protein